MDGRDARNSTAGSRELYERALNVMPGGNTRSTVYMAPHPIYAARGRGAHVIDVDGVERLDFANNFYSLIHGHAHPRIVAAVKKQVELGMCFGMPTETEVALAEDLCARHRAFQQVRFLNTGTEAVMTAIKAARAFTGRPMVAKCEGAYHGMYDHAEVSLDSAPANWGDGTDAAKVVYARGTPDAVLADTVVIPFNDVAAVERVFARHGARLAAVIVDAMPSRPGMVQAAPEFLSALRAATRRHGALLILDEVINFRLAPGGSLDGFDCEPDLVTLGKIIGGGFPVGALAGSREVMAVFDPRPGKPPLPQAGTFTANPMTMAAGLASMQMLTPDVYRGLDALGERVRAGIDEAFRIADLPGRAAGRGSLFTVHPHLRPLTDYRSTYKTPDEAALIAALHRHLLDNGFFLPAGVSGALSTPMTGADIDRFLDAFLAGLRAAGRRAA